MIQRLIDWAVANPLIVMLLGVALIVSGSYAVVHVNIEAYPDPSPAIIEVIAQYPGASAEEVERQVTVPLEVALSGMPSLQTTRSKSLFGLAMIRNQFDYSRSYEQAKQDVLNRLTSVELPPGVKPEISPSSAIGEILRFVLEAPKDPVTGKPIYTLSDLQSLEDFVIERSIRRVPRIAGVSGIGGCVKRYEVQPDPDQLRRHGITLAQVDEALNGANENGSGNNLTQGELSVVVRSLGLLGQGQDPQQLVMGLTDPVEAAKVLRAEEARRCLEIRQVIVATVNNVPIRVDQLVDGGPMLNPDGTSRVDDQKLVAQGVIVSNKPRLGRAAISWPQMGAEGKQLRNDKGEFLWNDEDDVVQGIVLLRKDQASLPALHDVVEEIDALNHSGLLPGVKIVPYYNRSTLIDRTTETVHENLIVGMALVTTILLMFLGNVRAAVIAAINIPLALMFAFGVLYLRGKSANLLSIGAVDFGIIVDSTVIIVETVYHKLQHDDGHGLSLSRRIAHAAASVQRSVFFATAVMVCALLPLFTMTGPEGQIFGPMADTYAFALAGALLLAITISPVLCLLLMKNLKPKPDNRLVVGMKHLFLMQLRWLLAIRWLALGAFIAGLVFTGVTVARIGREFMPELEEGGMLVRGTFPVNVSLDETVGRSRQFRCILQRFGELKVIPNTIGRPDDGTDSGGYYNVEANLPLRPQTDWPVDSKRGRIRTKPELIADISDSLEEAFPGVAWDISQIIRDNVLEALSGVKGENSIKIFGPDLATLENTATDVRKKLEAIPGIQNAGVFRIQGQSNLEFPVDRQKCARWGVATSAVQQVIESAVGGKAVTSMQEGGKRFDVSIRWPERLRCDEQAILAIPVPVANNVIDANRLSVGGASGAGSGTGLAATGTSIAPPSVTGNVFNPSAVLSENPTRRISDLVTPLNHAGQFDEEGSFLRPGASMIYREDGERFIAIKFEVRGRDLAGAVSDARAAVDPLVKAPYRAEWSGEFRQMEEAEKRMAKMFALSLVLITVMLYMAFRSFLDAAVVFANVLTMGVGGVWALKFMQLNFNISAAVGFISILGVAVMNGLLFVSSFNSMRSRGIDLHEALMRGTGNLVRPILMTALAAMLGLMPAAISHQMGAESQKPLAVVVVGGMIATILCLNVVPLLYSFYGKRTPPAGGGEMGH